MRAMVRLTRAMVDAMKRSIASKKVMASNNDNEMTVTKIMTITTTTRATNTIVTMMTLMTIATTKITTKTKTTTVRR
jgi:hypothetical protein